MLQCFTNIYSTFWQSHFLHPYSWILEIRWEMTEELPRTYTLQFKAQKRTARGMVDGTKVACGSSALCWKLHLN
jgi:hypothetical protein